jgi:hypothetical protein
MVVGIVCDEGELVGNSVTVTKAFARQLHSNIPALWHGVHAGSRERRALRHAGKRCSLSFVRSLARRIFAVELR